MITWSRKRTPGGSPGASQIRRAALVAATLAAGSAGQAAPPGSTQDHAGRPAEASRWIVWGILWQFLDRMEQALADPAGPPPSDTNSEQANVDKARDQIARYAASGSAPVNSPTQVAQLLDDIATIRSEILSDPDQFSDPIWDSYLGFLDALEADLQ